MNATDQRYFEALSCAAFLNPFGDEFAALIPVVEECPERVQQLDRHGFRTLREYAAEAEREQMRLVFLFEAYLRCRQALDALIAQELATPEGCVAAPFAREVLQRLQKRGLSEEEALRAFAIFFQIRRAHHFIEAGLVGSSEGMRAFRRRLWNNVFTHDIRQYERVLWNRMEDFSTLLLGETGTGKGAAAAAIGRSAFIPFDARKQCFAERFTRGFVSLNLAQFAEALLDSELFGHRKGAFTGAVEAHEGVLSQCSPYGAIFLDEIGEVPEPVQVKLLRVLQERTFSPVGSREVQPFRGRIIGATNRPLAELRGAKGLRDDFYYRLCSDEIVVPPLRDRIAEEPRELELLVRAILRRIAGEAGGTLYAMVKEGLQPLVRAHYTWPGNVRELEQAVRRIVLAQEYVATNRAGGGGSAPLEAQLAASGWSAEELLGRYCAALYGQYRNLEEVARRTQLDRRTVKRYLGVAGGGE